jgi:hypothetical protein
VKPSPILLKWTARSAISWQFWRAAKTACNLSAQFLL